MISPEDLSTLPIDEYAFPGPLRDALVGAILDGRKTSTTSLVADYDLSEEELPVIGERRVVVDSAESPVCVTEVTGVRVVPLGEVDLAHAIDEGEGFETVADWRAGHEKFWHGAEFREWMRDPEFTVTDATEAVLVRFHVTDRA
ncbi:ASCH domain-containing protein [Mycetocola zhujimingii]|uniref:ASCH domain-containing protein n=1 Tax=Mycetocola zhujimingii TaxID=2079792 RepID=UPI000D353A13|nr:ASCH domain-containing protein [Mycetocola zhujimingii]AWB87627.1 RNA-binding protein [Mycetocola zhujimingii]